MRLDDKWNSRMRPFPIRLCGVHFLLIVLVAGMSGSVAEHASAQDRPAHHTRDGFQNPHVEWPKRPPFAYWRMRLLGKEEFADQKADVHLVPIVKNPTNLKRATQGPRVTWLGHASFLIQYKGINILADPNLSNRASPFSFAGPKRLVPRPVKMQDLPRIDYVVISHNHYDHLDEETIVKLGNGPKYLVPLKLKPWFVSNGIKGSHVIEFDWWDKHTFQGLTVTATPSQHWSARTPFDRYETLWAAWHLDFGGFTAWFAGDTGYNPHQFREIGKRFGGVDLAMIPIGAYAPRWFMKYAHVTPEEAVLIHRDVKSRFSIGMHWGTFPLTAEKLMEPVERLKRAVDANALKGRFVTFKIGESRDLTPR